MARTEVEKAEIELDPVFLECPGSIAYTREPSVRTIPDRRPIGPATIDPMKRAFRQDGANSVSSEKGGFSLDGTRQQKSQRIFGALAFGLDTSKVEHVLAIQTLVTKRSKNTGMQVDRELSFEHGKQTSIQLAWHPSERCWLSVGKVDLALAPKDIRESQIIQLAPGMGSKDIILYVIGVFGTVAGTGAVIEIRGLATRSLSMEAWMSISNSSIEVVARAGMITPDETIFKDLVLYARIVRI